MKTTFEVRVHRNGQITLPSELRKRAHLETGMTLSLHDMGDGVLLLKTSTSSVSAIADRLAQQWSESGMSLEDMLAELRRVRTKNN
ncbi:MAG: hypothetical protein KPEEDBHJ_03376 [Anaerolineales bacterium]|nr:hypothetical protein [Anaerolineales bacterium]